ncbi:rRNA methyltransferase 3, mitochondrial isoform X2 [Sabethes cyaneus]|uniref:rRNA methyltransferase 3, mitochondrial isoform X2 n=1 Tax=Sabethes cyaneus TaxID=53552 RepID=UPI00237E89A5|nr:rRNA methyltransferase 3, mitochondrial isoform X2 [Sabethes cyaneus]
MKHILQQSNLVQLQRFYMNNKLKYALNTCPQTIGKENQRKRLYSDFTQSKTKFIINSQQSGVEYNHHNESIKIKTREETMNSKSNKLIETYNEIPKYLKLTKNNPMFGYLKQLVASRKKREREKKLVLEGGRLILDALHAGLNIDVLLFNDINDLKHFIELSKTVQLIQLDSDIMQQWSNLVTCPGLIGIFHKPKNMDNIIIKNRTTPSLPITVICDNIREPNNLGSIIRSCAAIPVCNVVLIKGCTHPWEPKCLRGSAGGHFRTQIIGPIVMNDLTKVVPLNACFLIADNAKDGRDGKFLVGRYDLIDYCDMKHIILVIGGETHGVSNDLRRTFLHRF